MAERVYLAVDLGAESGRVMAGLFDGSTVRLEELHRFANGPVNVAGTRRWDVLRLWSDIQDGLTKAAVIHLTKTAAAELGEHGIRANAIAPGFIDTPMVSPYWTRDDGTVDEQAKADTLRARASGSPLKATGESTDITYAMLYLASDASRFMTGQTLRPNGGVVMP